MEEEEKRSLGVLDLVSPVRIPAPIMDTCNCLKRIVVVVGPNKGMGTETIR